MKIKRNVEVPTNIGRKRLGEVSLAIKEFVDSDDANIKFECDSKEEATSVYSTASGFVNRYKVGVKVTRSMNDIYVVRKAGE